MARICAVLIVIAGFFVTGDITAVIRTGASAAAGFTERAAKLRGLCSKLAESNWMPSELVPPEKMSDRPASSLAPQRSHPEFPATAVRTVAVDQLRAGDRLLVLCGGYGGQHERELLAIDIIDHTRGEVLLTRHFTATSHSAHLRRMLLKTRIIESEKLLLFKSLQGLTVPQQGHEQSCNAEQIGPVIAIEVIHRQPSDT